MQQAPTHSWPSLKGETYAVLGLGISGLAAARHLLKLGAEICAADDRQRFESLRQELAPAGESWKSRIHPLGKETLPRCAALILSPGLPLTGENASLLVQQARKLGVPIFSDIEMFYRLVRRSGSHARFVGITGTNGKSTTTSLLGHILSQGGINAVTGGNIGIPALSLPLLTDSGVYVLELSSYMLETVQDFHPACAIWLNLTPDHLERHGTLENYAKAKTRLFSRMGAGNLAVFGPGIAGTEKLSIRLRQRSVKVCTIAPSPSFHFPLPLSLLGRHNAQNLSACLMAAEYFHVPESKILAAVQTYRSLPHRQQFAGQLGKFRFINDSKATNAEAADPALAAFEDIFWLAGGLAKESGIESLKGHLGHIRQAFLFGKDAGKLAETLAQENIPHECYTNLEEAFRAAWEKAREHGRGTVLLSPACASQDQFRNFEARGETFLKLAAALIKQET